MLRSSSASVVYWPGGAERVPGEVGELEDEFAGAIGVGAHERGDRVERVVDEMRADLGAQRQHLGAVESGAGGVELGEFDLAARRTGRLRRRRRACRVPGSAVVTTTSTPSTSPASASSGWATTAEACVRRAPGVPRRSTSLRGALAGLDRPPHPRSASSAGRWASSPPSPSNNATPSVPVRPRRKGAAVCGGFGVEALAQRPCRQRGGVQRGVHGAFGGGGHDAAGAHREDRGGHRRQEQRGRQRYRELARTSHLGCGCWSP